jgi:hypothetical protein
MNNKVTLALKLIVACMLCLGAITGIVYLVS